MSNMKITVRKEMMKWQPILIKGLDSYLKWAAVE